MTEAEGSFDERVLETVWQFPVIYDNGSFLRLISLNRLLTLHVAYGKGSLLSLFYAKTNVAWWNESYKLHKVAPFWQF